MAIDAVVEIVIHRADGSGLLSLEDRPGLPPGRRGQPALLFSNVPEEVTLLSGREVWGDEGSIYLGDRKIADRVGATEVRFVPRDEFLEALHSG